MPKSSSNQSSIAHKRSPGPYRVQYWPVALADDFPIWMHYPHLHDDRPIEILHVHDCWEIGCCFENHGLFVVGSKLLPFSAGHISVIGPTEPHLARSAPGSTSKWAWIYFNPLALLGSVEPDIAAVDPSPLRGPRFTNLISDRQNPTLHTSVTRLVDELVNQRPAHRSAVRAIIWQIMLELHRIAPRRRSRARSGTSGGGGVPFDRIGPALQHIARHYDQPLTIDALASRCRLSQPQFRRVFQQTLGKSPREYWLDLRVHMAASLLRSSDAPILEISQRVGFTTLSSFNRAFRRILRTTPRAFRTAG